MKKIFLFLIGIAVLSMSACSDMLEVESDRSLTDPSMNKATDSLFYAWGITQAMQQCADQYVLQNEMRGDLVSTTTHSSTHLKQLANFTADASNKYDSAYVYYKVINNCNYYLAHRDTAIYDGSYNLTKSEYASVLTFRAWAYLQLAKQYGKVKFYTEPLTTISQIENDNSPELTLKEIVSNLSVELEKYTGVHTPTPKNNPIDGMTNASQSYLYIPVDVMLGEMYLEVGDWQNAAYHYYVYLFNNQARAEDVLSSFSYNRLTQTAINSIPTDFSMSTLANSYVWSSYVRNGNDMITYIPMGKNVKEGLTTELPELFGYEYNSVDESTSAYLDEIQITSSSAYESLADSAVFYYQSNEIDKQSSDDYYNSFTGVGDMRRNGRCSTWGYIGDGRDSIYYYPNTYESAQIVLYRVTTIWLHLAEALNRMGYPDAAFAILKDGITDDLLNSTTSPYITEETKTLLTTTLPFCSVDGSSDQSAVFSGTKDSPTKKNYGIHRHGCSDAYGCSGNRSKYQFDTVVGKKLAELSEKFNIQFDSLKSDTILAVEDLLCDEYAMELAFEGTRFSDLMRLARNKNTVSTYGANFGNTWLSKKYESRGLSELLMDENNWYLPFK